MMNSWKKGLQYVTLCSVLMLSFCIGTLTGYEWNQTKQKVEKVQVESPAILYQFYLAEDNGMLTVYQTSNGEVYEYTDILIQELPETIKEEVAQKKYILDEEELYNFLETYTS